MKPDKEGLWEWIDDDGKDIPWPDPLDRSKIKDSKEKLDQNFKDGIQYFQG